jgi:hypothetical protein
VALLQAVCDGGGQHSLLRLDLSSNSLVLSRGTLPRLPSSSSPSVLSSYELPSQPSSQLSSRSSLILSTPLYAIIPNPSPPPPPLVELDHFAAPESEEYCEGATLPASSGSLLSVLQPPPGPRPRLLSRHSPLPCPLQQEQQQGAPQQSRKREQEQESAESTGHGTHLRFSEERGGHRAPSPESFSISGALHAAGNRAVLPSE